jgi:hypothetical protein
MPSIEEVRKLAVAAKEAAKSKIEMAKKEAIVRKNSKPIANPLSEIEVTGDTEIDDAAEATEVLGALGRARQTLSANQEQGYWRCLVFQSNEQAEIFMRNSGWAKHLDSSGVYIDGLAVSKELGIVMPPDHRVDSYHGGDKRIINEVEILKGQS